LVDENDILLRIKEIEISIDDAMWKSLKDEDHKQELQAYEKAKKALESIDVSVGEVKRERDRVLSYCLMRINDALKNLERSDGSIERAEESLRFAEESKDRVQILRSKLALGVALLNSGRINDAERLFADIILHTKDEFQNREVIQVYGWTLIVRVNVLLGKSLYSQAQELANQALDVLSGIENYAGLRTVHSLLARIYQLESKMEDAESHARLSDHYADLAKTLKR
jgi:tetratricopeptide (TPR) repeat protein